MNLLKISIFFACISIAACKKPKPQPPIVPDPVDTTATYDSYSALKVGNYWVYQAYDTYISNDSSVAQARFDSCYVEKDTLINNITYYKYCTRTSLSPYSVDYTYLRDSLHYIVSSYGSILFSSEDFTTVFIDKPFGPSNATGDTVNVKKQMTDKDKIVSVPAGIFTASAISTIFYYPPGSPKSDIYERNWYAKNVGRVKYTNGVYLGFPDLHMERWLVRYHVQ